MRVEVWLYDPLAHYMLRLACNSSLQDLIHKLKILPEEIRIAFINGESLTLPGAMDNSAAMLHEGDQVDIYRKVEGGMQ
jgi:hypothetical protein